MIMEILLFRNRPKHSKEESKNTKRLYVEFFYFPFLNIQKIDRSCNCEDCKRV